MRKKEQAIKAREAVQANCEIENRKDFGSVSNFVWKKTLPYVEMCDLDCDKFSIATICKDTEAINKLYDTVHLDDMILEEIKKLLSVNSELLLTLNPFILQDKYSFLKPFYNDLSLDAITQDRLLSLDDFELRILKGIVNLTYEYGVNPSHLIFSIISIIGRSSIPGRNNEESLDKIENFFEIVKELDSEQTLDDVIMGNIGYILLTGIFPKNKDELRDFNKTIKEIIFERINESDSAEEMKYVLFNFLFAMRYSDAEDFVKGYDLDGVSNELLMEPGIVELMAIKMIINEEDIDKLREISMSLLNDKDFSVNLFNSCLLEANVLKVYAKEFNKCKPNFSESNFISLVDGVKFYDAGNNFYSIVKTLGAFSNNGEGYTNYYDEWNNDRYRSHVNAVSLIRNDNLAFAEQDGKQHIKLGFYNFGEEMFLGGSNSDCNSNSSSRDFSVKINSTLSCPSKFIDMTREWHNELDYERKNPDTQSREFKKNPDFIILDQECEDMSQLSIEDQEQFDEYKNNTIKAAKEFGNLPVLVINREKIAKNEIGLINAMMEEYETAHDFALLKSVIIKFNNNRNGCRGPQHVFIRERYFSNAFFQQLLDRIDTVVLDEQRDLIYNFVKEENEKMSNCLYDRSTKDLPIEASNKTKSDDLNGQESLDKIDAVVLDEQKDLIYNFVKEENAKMSDCLYDRSPDDLLVEASNKTKSDDLNGQESLDKIDSVVLDEQRDLIYNSVKEENAKMFNCSYDRSPDDLPVAASNKAK